MIFRFANLSSNSVLGEGVSNRTPAFTYQASISPDISHLYIKQYAGSEYNLERDFYPIPQVPYTYEIDNAYDDYSSSNQVVPYRTNDT